MVKRIYVPSMHGPWYSGSWLEVVENENSYHVFSIRSDGTKSAVFWCKW
jgi:hypothetical protein